MNLAFWRAAGERAAKTAAQVLLATLTVSSPVVDVLHLNWPGVFSVTVGAALLSVLTSLASLPGVPPPNPAVQAAAHGQHEAA